jgi:hypothetical protein
MHRAAQLAHVEGGPDEVAEPTLPRSHGIWNPILPLDGVSLYHS